MQEGKWWGDFEESRGTRESMWESVLRGQIRGGGRTYSVRAEWTVERVSAGETQRAHAWTGSGI